MRIVLRRMNGGGYCSAKMKPLLNPTARDWRETSKAIWRLYLMKDTQPTKLRTLRNDALIARLAVIHDGFVVTHDIDDYSQSGNQSVIAKSSQFCRLSVL